MVFGRGSQQEVVQTQDPFAGALPAQRGHGGNRRSAIMGRASLFSPFLNNGPGAFGFILLALHYEVVFVDGWTFLWFVIKVSSNNRAEGD